MNLTPSTSVKRDELLDSIRKGRLVVVAGAGVSLYSVGFPSQPATEVAGWVGLLKSGVEYCERNHLVGPEGSDIVKAQIGNGSTDYLIDAAQKIHDWMNARSMARHFWLKETIGQLQMHDPALITAIQNLGGLIATLNYDDLIQGATKRPSCHWQQPDQIDTYIRNGSVEFILHIHGYWQAIDSVVLDRQSYEIIKANSKMQQLLQYFARWRTLLFVGCGQTFLDPNFEVLLRWCEGALRDAPFRHFILCRSADETGLVSALKPYGFLEPLSYGDDYADLIPFLNGLAKDSGEKAMVANPPSTPAIAIPNVQKASEIWKVQIQ